MYGPLQLGAIAGDKVVAALKEVGNDAGKAFQIADDILDVIGDEKKFGKKPLGDLYEGKVTLIILHAYKNATPEEKAKINGIYRKRRSEKTWEINFLNDMIKKYGSIASYAKARLEDLRGEGQGRCAEVQGHDA